MDTSTQIIHSIANDEVLPEGYIEFPDELLNRRQRRLLEQGKATKATLAQIEQLKKRSRYE